MTISIVHSTDNPKTGLVFETIGDTRYFEVPIKSKDLPGLPKGTAPATVKATLYGPKTAPIIVAIGGISANMQVVETRGQKPGWWADLIGPGKSVNTDNFQILSFDWILPKESDAVDPDQDFPVVTTCDQADALKTIIKALGCNKVHHIIGASYGAMVSLCFARRHAKMVNGISVICGAHESHPMAQALRHIQREILKMGVKTGDIETGVSLARQLAMTTYRSPNEFDQRFRKNAHHSENSTKFPVVDYLEYKGRAYQKNIDINRYGTLSQSVDLHRVDATKIKTPTTLIAFDQDQLVPLADMKDLYAKLKGPKTLTIVESNYGHDCFLINIDDFGPDIKKAIKV
jgi:homoserine O-acetyltransferase